MESLRGSSSAGRNLSAADFCNTFYGLGLDSSNNHFEWGTEKSMLKLPES